MNRSNHALRLVIADDEAPARSRIRDLLEDCAATMALQVVGEAANGRELIELLERTPADVALLDIRMPEMDGIEAAQHLRRMSEPPAVIFTTAYDSYALKAFELHAVDYLVKPGFLRRLHDACAGARYHTAAPGRTARAGSRAPQALERAGARADRADPGGQDLVHARRAEIRHHSHRRGRAPHRGIARPPRAGVPRPFRAHPPKLPCRARPYRPVRTRGGRER